MRWTCRARLIWRALVSTRPNASRASWRASHSRALRAEYPTSRSEILDRPTRPTAASGSIAERTARSDRRVRTLVSARWVSATRDRGPRVWLGPERRALARLACFGYDAPAAVPRSRFL